MEECQTVLLSFCVSPNCVRSFIFIHIGHIHCSPPPFVLVVRYALFGLLTTVEPPLTGILYSGHLFTQDTSMVSALQRFHCTCMHTTVGRNERTLVYNTSCRVSPDSCATSASPFLSDMLLTVNDPKLEEERTGSLCLYC